MFTIKGPVLAATTLEDQTDEVLRQADAIARFYGTSLHICHVLPELLAVRPLFPHLHLDDALKVSELESSARSVLRDRIVEVTGRGADEVAVTLEHGTPHSGILSVAERIQAGAVVVGGPTKMGQYVLGRTAELVVRHALSPVLVARPSRVGTVLAATDFSDQALPAVHAGVAEARRRGVALALIHAVDLVPPWLPLPLALTEGIEETQRKKLDDCVRRYEAGGGGLLRNGPADTAILQAAEELPVQLLVIGTHGRTGLKRLALGSVAESVLRGASCSVLVVRLAS